jgi:site-specific recombinase XerD
MATILEQKVPTGASLTSLVNGFILTKRTECPSPKTAEYYEGILGRFLWHTKQNQLSDDARLLNEWHIRDFLSYVSSQTNRWGMDGNGSESSKNKASYTTTHHYYRVLKTFFTWCINEKFLVESPMARIKFANPRLKIIKPYTTKEMQNMLAVCDYDFRHNAQFLASRNKAIIMVLLDTGLRVSELSGMMLDDIDRDRGRIHVVGKGAKERVVRIGATAQKALWKYLVYRPDNRFKEVWLTEEGKPMKRSSVQIMIRRVKERAGIQGDGSCHRFRHTFAINFLRMDRNPFNLQYLLGHSDLRMVKHYVAALGMEDALKAHESASPADMISL